MKKSINEVLEGLQEQSADEKLGYSLTTTPWGGVPSNAVVKAYEAGSDIDVTATVFPANVPTIFGDVITTDKLRNLTKDKTYRIEIGWDDTDGYHWEAMFRLLCTF